MANKSVKDLLASASAVLTGEHARLLQRAPTLRNSEDMRDMQETAMERLAQSRNLMLLANMYGPVLQDLVELSSKGVNHTAVVSEMSASKLDGSAIDVIFSRHDFTLEKGALK